jgi:hypothetical protein
VLPQNAVNDVRVLRIELHLNAAGVLVDEENLFPGRAAVRRAEDAALGVRTVRMPETCDKDDVRLCGMDDEAADLLHVRKANVLP